jgi:DNA-binding NtrC family response regulator
LKILYDYDWPGNVRELENMLERCMILSDSDHIDIDTLPASIASQFQNQNQGSSSVMFGDESPVLPFEKLKEEAIRHALKVTDGNIVEAARRLKIGRATLYRLMDKYKIDSPKE